MRVYRSQEQWQDIFKDMMIEQSLLEKIDLLDKGASLEKIKNELKTETGILYSFDALASSGPGIKWENAIRPFAISRKNWMFSDTPRGAQSSAILYSLIESAKLNTLQPYDYLFYIYSRIPYAKTREDYLALLPCNLNQDLIKATLD